MLNRRQKLLMAFIFIFYTSSCCTLKTKCFISTSTSPWSPHLQASCKGHELPRNYMVVVENVHAIQDLPHRILCQPHRRLKAEASDACMKQMNAYAHASGKWPEVYVHRDCKDTRRAGGVVCLRNVTSSTHFDRDSRFPAQSKRKRVSWMPQDGESLEGATHLLDNFQTIPGRTYIKTHAMNSKSDFSTVKMCDTWTSIGVKASRHQQHWVSNSDCASAHAAEQRIHNVLRHSMSLRLRGGGRGKIKSMYSDATIRDFPLPPSLRPRHQTRDKWDEDAQAQDLGEPPSSSLSIPDDVSADSSLGTSSSSSSVMPLANITYMYCSHMVQAHTRTESYVYFFTHTYMRVCMHGVEGGGIHTHTHTQDKYACIQSIRRTSSVHLYKHV
jgi:hypothetical protein